MKKVFLVFSVVFVFACIISSCSRVCTCQGYIGGFPIGDAFEENIDLGEKCSSLNQYDESLRTGTKCR